MLCVCVSIGAWAAVTITGNRALNADQNAGECVLIVPGAAGDISADASNVVSNMQWYQCVFVVGPVSESDITTLNGYSGSNNIVLDLTLASGLNAEWLSNLTNTKIQGVGVPEGFNHNLSNSNLKLVYSSSATGSKNWDGDSRGGNTYTIFAKEDGGLSLMNNMFGKTYLQKFRDITLSGNYTDAEYTALSKLENIGTITAGSAANVSFEVEGPGIQAKLEAMDDFDASTVESLTISGNLSAEDIDYLSGLNHVSKLDVFGVTNVADVVVPAGVTDLTVPAGPTLPSDYSAATGLKYIYGVSSATVPQSVKILQGGGLTQAAADHADLKTGNVKVIGEITGDDITTTTDSQGNVSVSSGLGDIFTATTNKVIDLSEATFASPLDVTSIWQANGDYCSKLVYILPEDVTAAQLNKLQNPGEWTANTFAYYDGKDKINIFPSTNTTNSDNLNLLASYVPEGGRVTFIPNYNANGTVKDYLQWQSGWWTAVNSYAAGSMNFNYVNISELGTDFSGLNSTVHYLIIPTANKNTDGTVTYPDMDNESGYRYSEGVYAVSTFKDAGEGTSSRVNYDGITYDAKSSSGAENTQVTYVTAAGHGKLSTIVDELNENMNNATRLNLLGTLTADDLEQLGKIQIGKVDLYHAHFASGVTYASYSSQNARYLLLPAGETGDLATAYNSYGLSANCPNLWGIMEYDKTSQTLQTHTTNADMDNGFSHVQVLGDMLYYVEGFSETTRNVKNLVMSGYLNDDDISTSAGLSRFTFPAYTPGEDVVLSYTNETTGALETKTVKGKATGGLTANLEKAYFPTNDEMNFASAGWATYLTHIDLPTYEGNKKIPEFCFNLCAGLSDICIPYCYEVIEDGAFINSNVSHITTTGSNNVEIDNGENTFTFSANLKRIGSSEEGAAITDPGKVIFATASSALVTDVYVLATKTPICSANSFAANMYYGWGGFKGGTFPYCREKYANGSMMFTVLHFPHQGTMGDDEYLNMKKMYTDISKVYTKKEQTGAVDANGDPIAWPTFSELRRVYNQATASITWNNWIAQYDSNQEVNGGDNIPTTSQPTGTGAGNNDIAPYVFAGYEGWHQFVLSLASYVEPEKEIIIENEKIVRQYENAGWFTFCIPFDMTVREVVELMGVPASDDTYTNKYNGEDVGSNMKMPDIRQLASVTRKKADANNPRNTVTFTLTRNLNNGGTVTNFLEFYVDRDRPSNVIEEALAESTTTGLADPLDACCLRGGRPYIIKAYKQVGETIKGRNLGQYVMDKYGEKFKESASCLNRDIYEYLGGASDSPKKATLKFAKPFENNKVQAVPDTPNPTDDLYLTYVDENNKTQRYYYTLVGQFWEQKLPKYCIYMSGNKWYRNSTDNDYKWSPYKCVIMATPVDETDTRAQSGKYRDNDKSFYPSIEGTDLVKGDLKIVFKDGRDDDDFDTAPYPTLAKYSFVLADDIMEFDDQGNDITAIETLDGMDFSSLSTSGKVYNMAGQYVGSSLEGLGKGMYIVDGKKFVVK